MITSLLQNNIKRFFFFVFVFIVTFSFNPSKAFAQLAVPQPVVEVGPALGGVTATAAAATTQTLIIQTLNGLAWTVAKTAVNSITRSTVNWINSGFQGSPAFVTDLGHNLQNVGDAIAENFFAELDHTTYDATGFNIRSPFQDQIAQKLREQYYMSTSDWGINPYTLGQYSDDPTAFLNGDFSHGGFNASLAATQNPGNNPFGAYLQAQHALFAQVDQATGQRKTELDWGKGFLSYRGGCAKATNAAVGALTDITLSHQDDCVGHKILSPGTVVESQLEKAVGNGVEQLQIANSINEIVGALAGQMVNQVLGSGGLSGVSQPSSGGGRSYLSQATDSSNYNQVSSSLSTGFQQNLTTQSAAISAYQANEQKIFDTATTAKQACSVTNSAQLGFIQRALDSASAGISKASIALSQIATLSDQVTAAQNTAASERTTSITDVLSQNQGLLSSNILPSASEVSAAAADVQDTGTNTPASLYTSLKQVSASCGTPII